MPCECQLSFLLSNFEFHNHSHSFFNHRGINVEQLVRKTSALSCVEQHDEEASLLTIILVGNCLFHQ